jgi:DNA-binding beta-propeller fold protein YncE
VARSGYVLEACTRTISRNIAFGGKPLGALSFDGRHLYEITLQRKTASVIDTATEKVVRTFPVTTAYADVASSDGRRLYVASDNQVSIYDTATGSYVGARNRSFPSSIKIINGVD